MTDPIADMLTRVRNAVSARHNRVDLPASKLKAEIARILQDEGYISGYRLVEEKPARPGGTARPVMSSRLRWPLASIQSERPVIISCTILKP